MPIAFTSRLGLAQITADLNGRRREVYTCIAEWPAGAQGAGPSIEDIAARLGIKESSVCGRVHELRAAGAIEDAPLKTNASGNQAKTYRALAYREYQPPQNAAQPDLFAGVLAQETSPYQTRI